MKNWPTGIRRAFSALTLPQLGKAERTNVAERPTKAEHQRFQHLTVLARRPQPRSPSYIRSPTCRDFRGFRFRLPAYQPAEGPKGRRAEGPKGAMCGRLPLGKVSLSFR